MHRLLAGLLVALWSLVGAGPIAEAQEATVEVGIANTGELRARDIIIKKGLSEDEIITLMRSWRAEESASVQMVAELAAKLAVNEAAVTNFLHILDEQEVADEQLLIRLAEIAARHVELVERLAILDPEADPEITALVQEARAAIEVGEYDRADDLLARAEEAELAAARQAEDLAQQAAEAAEQRFLRAAERRAERGELSMARLDYLQAAAHFEVASGLVPATEPDVRGAYLNRLGEAFYRAGDYPAAVEVGRRALALDEARLPSDDVRLATTLNNLALYYQAVGRYDEARPLYDRAVTIGEKTLGPGHRDLGYWLNNLGSLYRSLRRYAEAETLYQRAIGIGENTLGPEHPDLAVRLNNLGELYMGAGRFAEAEAPLKRAIDISERTGPEHPDLVIRLNNLGQLYWATHRCAEAETFYQRAIDIGEKTLPADHPSLAIVRSNYATLLDKKRDGGRCPTDLP